MSGYHYIQSEPGLWTVGTGTPSSQGGTDWEPESDHSSVGEAASRVAYLNGGSSPSGERVDDGLRAAVGALVDQLGELTGVLRGMAERMTPAAETSPAGRDSESSPEGPAVATTGQPGDAPVDERAARIAGLRELADFLAANPDVPAPSLTAHYFAELLPGGAERGKQAAVAELDRVGALVGVEPKQGLSHVYVTRRFTGDVEYRAVVCEVDLAAIRAIEETAAGATTGADTVPAADGEAIRGADPSGRPDPTTPGDGPATQDIAPVPEEVAGPAVGVGPATAAAGPEVEHRQVGGAVGGPGENAAVCACGTTYAGFDTHAEAVAVLERHIELEG